FKGKVDFISSEAEFAPRNIQTKEERLKLVYMVKSYLDNPAGELKPGMPVDVKITMK
ncbi:MAG: ABC transporter substrate-binding protein, partial [Candidatus Aminicenantes bacterium]|nr:ABC transporter substrate-binding protein [Candidatus Aminicenantes bacterium]